MSIELDLKKVINYALAGKSSSAVESCEIYELWQTLTDPNSDQSDSFYKKAARKALSEIERLLKKKEFKNEWSKLISLLDSGDDKEIREQIWRTLFPEALYPTSSYCKDEQIKALREKRTVTVKSINQNPIESVVDEVIFTSNVLLTLPDSVETIQNGHLPLSLKDKIYPVMNEPQLYWYDHPILLGCEPEGNELLYGLKGLAETVKHEKEIGNCPNDSRLTVILSFSVTHNGLKNVGREWVEFELSKAKDITEQLCVYLFTEDDCVKISKRVANELRLTDRESRQLDNVFGVDGRYGRHYSFLKAILPFWQSQVDSKKRATFKIDLDQVFPQDVLVEQSGNSCFEHLTTNLWGATGVDSEGREVELGMIAGGLVNESDISESLYYSDIPYPKDIPSGENLLFFKQYPMAISTDAELLTRYGKDGIDGINKVIHRIHVTGGTNGILAESLRKYRPFTPSFIGRAEDQALLLSVLFKSVDGSYLRYLHKDGFRMRHDKEAFAGEAIAKAKLGTYIGDLERTLLFSKYADILEGGIEKAKDQLDPFTGAFIHRAPWVNILLRLMFHHLDLIEKDPESALILENEAAKRLKPLFRELEELPLQVKDEKEGWDIYYNSIEKLDNDSNKLVKDLLINTKIC